VRKVLPQLGSASFATGDVAHAPSIAASSKSQSDFTGPSTTRVVGARRESRSLMQLQGGILSGHCWQPKILSAVLVIVSAACYATAQVTVTGLSFSPNPVTGGST